MQAKYIVAHKRNRTTLSMKNAGAVARYMWGRDFNDYCVYQRQDNLPSEIGQCQAVLVAREAVLAPSVSSEPKKTQIMGGDSKQT